MIGKHSFFDRGEQLGLRKRIYELERQMNQVAPRESASFSVATGAFPTAPYLNQIVYRVDLIPAGWYKWDGAAWVTA